MAIEIVDLELEDENTSRRGSNKRNPISVEAYAQERDFSASVRPATQSIIVLSKDEDDEVQILDFNPLPIKKRLRAGGESSNARQEFTCEICLETKPLNESFNVKGCTHFYCSECVIKYVGYKLQESIIHIRCPDSGCPGLLSPEYCLRILPAEVFQRWFNARMSASVMSQKFYCPYEDCSALLLINDCNGNGEEVIGDQCECPYCRRLFCLQCKVEWHSGIDCFRFQKLNKDEREKEDIMLMKLAADRKWQRCPACKFYVERTEGCPAMRCRCGCHFCYKCGGSPCQCWKQSAGQSVAAYVAGARTMRWYGAGADSSSTQQYNNAAAAVAAATSLFSPEAAADPLNSLLPYFTRRTMNNPYLAQAYNPFSACSNWNPSFRR